MQAIETKFLGPTNTKGARIKASARAGSVTVPYEYQGVDEEHDQALRALVTKLEWWGVWARGGKADCTGNVYVCISRPDIRTPPPICTNPLDYIVVRPPEETKP
jgi:hypothetical protein